MSTWTDRWRRPTPATLVAGGMVVLGFALMQVHSAFLLLAALGTFGPGLLRELGWLRDQDEFQRRAAHRAGYHAFLATGFLVFLLVIAFRSPEVTETHYDALVNGILSLLWFTWFLSWLLAYWGPRRGAQTLLIAFGVVWLIFNVVGNLDSAMALLMQSLLALPFFALAWLARRWPRLAGALLVGVAVWLGWFFDMGALLGPDPLTKGRLTVLVLFIGPLLAGGLALLTGREVPDES